MTELPAIALDTYAWSARSALSNISFPAISGAYIHEPFSSTEWRHFLVQLCYITLPKVAKEHLDQFCAYFLALLAIVIWLQCLLETFVSLWASQGRLTWWPLTFTERESCVATLEWLPLAYSITLRMQNLLVYPLRRHHVFQLSHWKELPCLDCERFIRGLHPISLQVDYLDIFRLDRVLHLDSDHQHQV